VTGVIRPSTPVGTPGPVGVRRSTVLLADDHGVVAEGLRRLLEPEFEVVAVVPDGPSLLEAARRLRPDVVVADLAMPGLSGLEAARLLAREGAPSRVVILTMYAEAALAGAARRAGALGFVSKHAAAEELLAAVRAAERGQAYFSPLGGNGGGDGLSPRQREVLRLLAGGLTMKAIGARLGLSARTVETHKYEAMQRLGAQTTAALIRYAAAAGLVPAPDEVAGPAQPRGATAPGAPVGQGGRTIETTSRAGTPPARVVLADDHAAVRATVLAVLEPEFDVVAAVADGHALLEAARRLRPDVVVADLEMPGLSGIAATARLTREVPGARVVLLTSDADPPLLAASRAAGALGYVLKSRAAEELVPVLRAVLGGSLYVSLDLTPGRGR
jgi:DNA-binding NarL/FixJ family response regulator